MPISPEHSRLVFQKAQRALTKLASGEQPERVHDFRIGVRRLETLLAEFDEEHGRNHKKLLKVLGRLRKRAGKVRDLDVQLAALRSLKMPQEPRRKARLMSSLIELRADREKKLCKLLSKKAVREVCKRLREAETDLKLADGREPLTVARELLAKVVRPQGPITEEMLHQYRILGKRARYAAELGPKSSESEQFIAQLKRVQDAVGDWHDWLKLTESAAKRLGEVPESSLVAVLHNVTRVKFRHAVAALSAWNSLQVAAKTARSVAHKSGVGADSLAARTSAA